MNDTLTQSQIITTKATLPSELGVDVIAATLQAIKSGKDVISVSWRWQGKRSDGTLVIGRYAPCVIAGASLGSLVSDLNFARNDQVLDSASEFHVDVIISLDR